MPRLGWDNEPYRLNLSLPRDVEIELTFALIIVLCKIQTDKKCNIWARNLPIGKAPRSCPYTLLLPQGKNSYNTSSSFRDTDQFSKLPYLIIKPGHCYYYQTLHTIFPHQGVETRLISFLWAAVSEISKFSTLSYSEMKTGPLTRLYKWHMGGGGEFIFAPLSAIFIIQGDFE